MIFLELLRQWAWGLISAVMVQTMAMKAYEDVTTTLEKAGMSADHAPSSLLALRNLGRLKPFRLDSHSWPKVPNTFA